MSLINRRLKNRQRKTQESVECKFKMKEKVGSGTYGNVYITEYKPNEQEVEILAMKRNFIDKKVDFFGSLRELDILMMLRDHPSIIKLKFPSFGNPYGANVLSPLPEKDIDYYKEDPLFFAFEAGAYDGHRLIYGDYTAISYIKMAMVQFLTGVEYIHSKGIVHRDLKPSNLIWVRDGSHRYLKICDYGMSKVSTRQEPSTPRVATSWYRAPEVAGGRRDYTSKIDMWSVGCILFEMVSKYPLFKDLEEDDSKVINAILSKVPTLPTEELIRKLNISNYQLKPMVFSKRRKTWHQYLNLSDKELEYFDQKSMNGLMNDGSYEDFLDLLNLILQPDPDIRISATMALNHRFFSGWRAYIDNIRSNFPPIPDNITNINILYCYERLWAAEICFSYYNSSDDFIWYKHRIIFHSLRLFDRYLEHSYNNNKFDQNIVPTIELGQLHDRDEGEMRFLVCLYICIKYFTVGRLETNFNDLYKNGNIAERHIDALKFERFMIMDVLNFKIYEHTVLEVADFKSIVLDDNNIQKLLVNYGKCQTIINTNILTLFDMFMNDIIPSTDTNFQTSNQPQNSQQQPQNSQQNQQYQTPQQNQQHNQQNSHTQQNQTPQQHVHQNSHTQQNQVTTTTTTTAQNQQYYNTQLQNNVIQDSSESLETTSNKSNSLNNFFE